MTLFRESDPKMTDKKTPMLFQGLTIEKARWGGKGFTGSVSFASDNARVNLNITTEMVGKIMDLCADSLLDAAHEMSDVMRGDIIEALPVENRKRIK